MPLTPSVMTENLPSENPPPATSGEQSGPDPLRQAFQVLVANEQATLAIDEPRLIQTVRMVLAESEYATAFVSIAVVDDPTIHELNKKHLQHDYPTDVLSFVLEQTENSVEGELVVSADTAMREASDAGWTAFEELLLYIIHGVLHLIGYDDHAPEDQVEMYAAEAHFLQRIGVALPTERSRWIERSGEGSSS